MDQDRFDRLIRSLASRRRTILFSLALAPGGIAVPRASAASPCTIVGKGCAGKSECCSGICMGKKGKKTCRPHDTGGCTKGQNSCSASVDIACTAPTGVEGLCYTTTGHAGYCGTDGQCAACARDADCRDLFGPTAACVQNCALCSNTGGFVCFGNGIPEL